MKTKPVEFQIPEGFTIPEGTEPGEDFDSVCTFRVRGNGTLLLAKLGECDMPGCKQNGEDRAERPRYGQAKQMMTGETEMEEET